MACMMRCTAAVALRGAITGEHVCVCMHEDRLEYHSARASLWAQLTASTTNGATFGQGVVSGGLFVSCIVCMFHTFTNSERVLRRYTLINQDQISETFYGRGRLFGWQCMGATSCAAVKRMMQVAQSCTHRLGANMHPDNIIVCAVLGRILNIRSQKRPTSYNEPELNAPSLL